jgi:hypothetical protein
MIQALGNKRILPELAGKLWKSLEHRSSIPNFFSGFRPTPYSLLVENGRKKPETFRPEYCFRVSAIFEVFLPETARTL